MINDAFSRMSLWETEWGGRAIFSNGSSSSRGVAILFRRDFTPTINKTVRDPNGRFVIIDFTIQEDTYTVGSFYAPTQDKPHEQGFFIDSVETAVDNMTGDTLVLGGDFNCILDPEMDKNSSAQLHATSDQYRNRLLTLMEERNLHDIFRVRFPKKKTYTFRRGSYASRLDLILLSTHLSN